MKFISFIASTMLIVLISQHSTMGLPAAGPLVEKKCSEGFKIIDGRCMPIDSKSNDDEVTPSSPILKPKVSKEDPVDSETNGDDVTSSPILKPKVLKEDPVDSKTNDDEVTSSSPILEPKVFKEDPVLKKYGACPEGMEHGEHGICKKIEPSEITKDTIETTTALQEEFDHPENLSGCPEGTKHDEQGACQEITPTNTTKVTTDPKALLKTDGSCPKNYQMLEGKCLYIKPKTKSGSYASGSTADFVTPNRIRPKSGNEESVMYEKVSILSDNSCPVGTEYSEYGLCQRRINPLNSKLNMKPDGSCYDGFELIDGKCTFIHSKIPNRFQFSTTISTLPIQSETTTTTVEKATIELPSETTSQPL